jgi:hypothetical protein
MFCSTLLCDFAYDGNMFVNISFIFYVLYRYQTKNVPFHFMEYVLLEMGDGCF